MTITLRLALVLAAAVPLSAAPAAQIAASPAPVARVPAPNDLAALNAAIAELLKPLNTPVSKASLVFYAVKTNATRAVEAAVGLAYERSGQKNKLVIRPQSAAQPTAAYSYPESAGAVPATTVNIEFDYDILKFLTQQQVNQWGPAANELAKSFAEDFRKEYGAAATVDAEPPTIGRDAKGDIETLSMTLGLKVDLAQLPATMKPEDVPVLEGTVSVAMSRQGGGLHARIVSNPAGKSFQSGETGLKESLDKLVVRDPAEMQRVGGWMKTLHDFAAYLVD